MRRHHRPGDRVIAPQHEDSQSGTRTQQLIDDAFGNGQRRHRPIAVGGRGAIEHGAGPAPLLVAQHVVGQELRHDEEIADVDDPGAERARREVGRLPKQRRTHRLRPKSGAARQPRPAIGRDPQDGHARRADGRQRSAPPGLNLGLVARAIERLLQRFARGAPRAHSVNSAAGGTQELREVVHFVTPPRAMTVRVSSPQTETAGGRFQASFLARKSSAFRPNRFAQR